MAIVYDIPGSVAVAKVLATKNAPLLHLFLGDHVKFLCAAQCTSPSP
ncbi:hypothetical protein USDA257_c06970 [Sinorhizobium fredii USDA 257]|uniref:Uncharacterized protein n=1 Tax=Sinorhizobium fredii (strain USDA 257) TaxID=1185652 RepID=I3X084_SINF2|nr:hypothetical protein USDA257_c06970 [Sinorhizobium fredii USDA 257]